ncbi:dimethyl sulfoxide reductase anchor subunit family protein [Sporomusa acidovorans]|uniref:Anaerobic dimethyl sulfoxide reductase chain C n=1 Tax=Sporomusa acidovorans (strain ATCC 49682 / DSM 3132 / Mol) TaxID=1123286 RepID=A0ABZ3J8T0_SPOA4|nr:DmsC/YnfH family molybdoenzyme membrane anchor subunit [Sporomusa acidovorans]OZC24130.1 DMSO reductase anchor subunit DmsC [Sporomusa acidovorans DSM 3132]SDF71643.1 anaerobic dimethyl sulfoxide reductase subunit C (DMSO reductase anchor subunit) [Sporomusa acidovorans]
MVSGEFYLVTYTILSQAAVGLVVMLSVGSKILGVNQENTDKYRLGLLTATILTVVAMLVSASHLGSPVKAMNAMLNLGSSWLSREIVLNGLFFVSVGGAYLLARKGKNFAGAAAIASGVGIVCVLCQAAIYANTVIPAWGMGHSYITFIGATCAMGAFLGVSFLLNGVEIFEHPQAKAYLAVALFLTFAGIVAQAGFYAFFAGQLAEAGTAGLASLHVLASKTGTLLLMWVCLVIALLGLGKIAYKKEMSKLIYVLTALVMVGEIVNRTIFYGIGVAIGL